MTMMTMTTATVMRMMKTVITDYNNHDDGDDEDDFGPNRDQGAAFIVCLLFIMHVIGMPGKDQHQFGPGYTKLDMSSLLQQMSFRPPAL